MHTVTADLRAFAHQILCIYNALLSGLYLRISLVCINAKLVQLAEHDVTPVCC